MAPRKIVISTLTVFAVSLLAWAFWLEPASLQVTEHRIEVPTWPSECDGLRIAVLADLHVGSPFNGLENLRNIVASTMAAAPDLILLPGDFVIQGVLGGQFVTPESAAEILATLRAPNGVFAVLGNHDWWLDAARVEHSLVSVGIPVLEDRSVQIGHDECTLHLVGVSDFWEGPHDLRKAFAEVPQAATSIVFTHNPDVFTQLPAAATLTIAGHTHGGQVYIPLVGRPVVPSQFGARYAIGHVREFGRDLFVSPGIGTSIVAVRFLVPPEISIVSVYRDQR